ncbi:putative disease resistance protein At3g14460 [Juglans regia]|nr:putative disease resistance protein At3g14460 [Juglans regia]
MPDKMHLFIPSLHYLEIKDCPEIESFPEGRLPSDLKEIEIHGCKKLIENWTGWGLQMLHSLQLLRIGGDSEKVESFPGVLLLPSTLTYLYIYSFKNLKSLDKEGFQHLTSLVQLLIKDCPKLKNMPEEGFPASLRFLQMRKCLALEKQLKRKEGKEWLKVARVRNIVIDDGQIQGIERTAPQMSWMTCSL